MRALFISGAGHVKATGADARILTARPPHPLPTSLTFLSAQSTFAVFVSCSRGYVIALMLSMLRVKPVALPSD